MNLLSGIEQDFHRPQKSPGAYEWWHFDGQDDHNGYCFSAQFYAGNPLSPYYQEALRRYLKDAQSPLVSPTVVTPPNPLDFCGVVFRVFKSGSLVNEFLQEFSPGQLKASEDHPAVLLGPNRFHWDASAQEPSYVVTLQGRVSNNKTLRARLFFTPAKTAALPTESSETFPTHSWVLAAPRCRLEGTLQWCDTEGETLKEIHLSGSGYHDHHFGTIPLDRFLKSWNWGHAFLDSKTLIYSYQKPQAADEKSKGLWMSLDAGEFKIWDVAFEPSQNRYNFFALPYSKKLGFTDFDAFEVRHRTILSDGPAALIFDDEVRWTQEGLLVKGPGISNYLYPPRLSNPLFFPMLKGKTDWIDRPLENGGAKPKDFDDVSTQRPDPPQK